MTTYKEIINRPAKKPAIENPPGIENPSFEERMIIELEYLQTHDIDKEEPFQLPKLNEFFSLGYSGLIIEGRYEGVDYDGKNGGKLLSILKEETELIFHNVEEVERGRSDYGFHTNRDTYVFKFNTLFLTIKTFTPRSLNNTRYGISCSDEYQKP